MFTIKMTGCTGNPFIPSEFWPTGIIKDPLAIQQGLSQWDVGVLHFDSDLQRLGINDRERAGQGIVDENPVADRIKGQPSWIRPHFKVS